MRIYAYAVRLVPQFQCKFMLNICFTFYLVIHNTGFKRRT